MELTKGQKDIIESDGHLLVTGGPGSGKTTISILKAVRIAKRNIRPGQKILFLSFARATVSRVVEAIKYERQIPTAQKRLIDVETYHSFFWRIIKAHGYLIGLPRHLTILTPPSEAIALSNVRSAFPARKLTNEQSAEKKAAENAERARLASEEGRVCFDFFAPKVSYLIKNSARIRCLIFNMYPVIILDEFQDTNDAQWHVVQALGEFCCLIALADPEQRIFDWIGADPARLDHFRKALNPTEIDLSTDNHRSVGTEITLFGNDILTGKFRQDSYKGIDFDVFDPFTNPAMTKLVTTVYKARKRLLDSGNTDWSLAILVPTKKMTRLVSDALRQPPAGMNEIPHTATIELEGAILGAEIIAFLMQSVDSRNFAQFIELICNYYQGKGGSEPKQSSLKEVENISKAYEEFIACQAEGKEVRKNSILIKMIAVYEQACSIELTGNPDKDWRSIRRVLEDGACKRLKEISDEVRNLRILNRGAQLRQELSKDWRDNRGYRNALMITQQAFIQEHFSMKAKPESGVNVMNMHKAKGKQFDEVIIFEGWPIKRRGQPPYNADRIVRFNSKDQIDDQVRQNFRVSVTRSKLKTTILTPKTDPCILLPANK